MENSTKTDEVRGAIFPEDLEGDQEPDVIHENPLKKGAPRPDTKIEKRSLKPKII